MALIDGCKNNYTTENIDRLFCESEEAERICENCPNFIYDSRIGEISCKILNDINIKER